MDSTGRERERGVTPEQCRLRVRDSGTIGELIGACGFRSMALGLTREKAQEIEGATVDSPDPSGEERKSALVLGCEAGR